jgi:hypothetical protein
MASARSCPSRKNICPKHPLGLNRRLAPPPGTRVPQRMLRNVLVSKLFKRLSRISRATLQERVGASLYRDNQRQCLIWLGQVS